MSLSQYRLHQDYRSVEDIDLNAELRHQATPAQLVAEQRKAIYFLGLLSVSTVLTSVVSTVAFVSRDSLLGLIASDAIAGAAWAFVPCLPLLWTQPSLRSCLFWVLIVLLYVCFTIILYIWNWQGENIACMCWVLFLCFFARLKLPAETNTTRFGLVLTVIAMAVVGMSNTVARETGVSAFAWGKACGLLPVLSIIYDSKYNSSQTDSAPYAIYYGAGLLGLPIIYLLILQTKVSSVFVYFGAMTFFGTVANWALKIVVGWAADPESGVLLMFPIYLAEDLFQTILFAETGTIDSPLFWGLVCAQEGANLLKHLGVSAIAYHYIERYSDPDSVHPWERPGWIAQLQTLAIQDSVSACISALFALTAGLVDVELREHNMSGATRVFSRQTSVEALLGLYGVLLVIRVFIAFLEHYVARRVLVSLRSFRYRTKLSEVLARRSYSVVVCWCLSCLVLMDSLKWQSYHLSGWPSLSGDTTNI